MEVRDYTAAVERAERAAQALADAKTTEEIAEAERAFNEAVAEAERVRKVLGLKAEQEDVEKRFSPKSPAEVGLSEKETRDYSILRAINALVTGDWSKAGLEKEASDEIAKRLGKAPNGFYLPMEVQRRDLTTASGGTGLVTTTFEGGSFIEMLRNKMVVKAAGARVLTGLVGNIAIPRQTGGATYYWVTEGNSVTASAPAFDQVTMSPKTGGAFVDISRALLKQSSFDVEGLVTQDLAAACAIALDYAALHGSGSSGQPTGVAATSGIGSVALGANGAAPSYGKLVELESKPEIANADMAGLAYITNPKVTAKLKTTPKVASTDSVMVYDALSYPVHVTNQVRSDLTKGTGTNLSAIFFGNWNDLIVGQWGTVDIMVDPYTGATSGTVRVIALQDVDVAVRHPGSFAAILDADTTIS